MLTDLCSLAQPDDGPGSRRWRILQLDRIESLKVLRDEASFSEHLIEIVRAFGLDYYVLVSFNVDKDGEIDFESHRHLVDCDVSWCQTYQERNWVYSDPFLHYAMASVEPVLFSRIRIESVGQRRMIEDAANFGIRSGIVFPSRIYHGGQHVVLYLVGKQEPAAVEPFLFAQRTLLRTLFSEVVEWWLQRQKDEMLASLDITEQHLRMLDMERQHFTSEEIAAEIGLTVSQVNNNFRRINSALGVRNKADAVRKVMNYGLLLIEMESVNARDRT